MTEALFNAVANIPPAFGAVWISLCILASIGYRIRSGKPIFVQPDGRAQFAERWTSGHSNRSLLTKLGGARNCLCVTVTDRELRIQPHFPFSLMFLPEIYGLDLRIPRASIRSVERRRWALSTGLCVSFAGPGARASSVQFYLRDEPGFLQAIGFELR